MDLRVKDKVYALVGGTGGMGLDAARVLAADGARIALIGRNRARGEPRARAMAEETGSDVRMFEADGTVQGQIEAAIEDVVAQFGRLDGLAVTAGTLQTRRTLTELDDATWEQYFHLIAAGGGTIVNTAAYSIRAMKPPLLGYATMKAAVAALTKNIALTYGAQNVRANTVCPGFIATESTHGLMKIYAEKYGLPPMEALNKALSADFHMNVAMGRVGLSEEIADLFAFLLSPRAGYLTGAVINCDGGTQF